MFDPKAPDEEDSFGFNFTDLLVTGESVASAVIEVEVIRGVDPNPGNMILSAPAIASPWVYIVLGGGVDEVIYCVHCLATTDQGLKKELRGDLRVTTKC